MQRSESLCCSFFDFGVGGALGEEWGEVGALLLMCPSIIRPWRCNTATSDTDIATGMASRFADVRITKQIAADIFWQTLWGVPPFLRNRD